MFLFKTKSDSKSIKATELEGLLNKINLIDIREPYENSDGHIPTAKNIPMGKILMNPSKYLDKSKEYYIVCQSGARSASTCGSLTEQGYNVINVVGGTSRYNGKLEY